MRVRQKAVRVKEMGRIKEEKRFKEGKHVNEGKHVKKGKGREACQGGEACKGNITYVCNLNLNASVYKHFNLKAIPRLFSYD